MSCHDANVPPRPRFGLNFRYPSNQRGTPLNMMSLANPARDVQTCFSYVCKTFVIYINQEAQASSLFNDRSEIKTSREQFERENTSKLGHPVGALACGAARRVYCFKEETRVSPFPRPFFGLVFCLRFFCRFCFLSRRSAAISSAIPPPPALPSPLFCTT